MTDERTLLLMDNNATPDSPGQAMRWLRGDLYVGR
jgi:hypothetical protein